MNFNYLLPLFLCLPVLAEVIVAKPNVSYKNETVVWYPSTKHITFGEEKLSREEQLLLQIFLDELNFTPGKIDGSVGKFTKEAAYSYYTSIGIPEEKSLHVAIEHAFERKNIPYTEAIVPKSAKDFINHSLPYKYSQLAKTKRVSYRSYGEYMAERYHTSEKFLKTLNGKSTINNLTTGKKIKVPNVAPFYIEDLEYKQYKSLEELEMNYAVIDTKVNTLKVFSKIGADQPDKLIAFFPITPGRKDQIKYGEWKIKNSYVFPTWRYDPKVLSGTGRSKTGINVPPGPNNPVGVMWNGLTAKSVGIHGTNDPDSIGRATSSGCIRMANWDVVRIPKFLRPGCRVMIQ